MISIKSISNGNKPAPDPVVSKSRTQRHIEASIIEIDPIEMMRFLRRRDRTSLNLEGLAFLKDSCGNALEQSLSLTHCSKIITDKVRRQKRG